MQKAPLESGPDSRGLGLFIFCASLAGGREIRVTARARGCGKELFFFFFAGKAMQKTQGLKTLQQTGDGAKKPPRARSLPQFPPALTSWGMSFAFFFPPHRVPGRRWDFFPLPPARGPPAAWVFLGSTAMRAQPRGAAIIS